ncbi:hypothetical protein V3C99_001632 [Haemonchus contortus]
MVLFLLFFHTLVCTSAFKVIDLGGQWDYYSTNKSIRGHGLVPGDIYSDLYRSKVITEPLFGDNHLKLAWIGAENWTYSRTFTVDPSLLKYRTVLLLLKGVDTISTVTLNDDILLNTSNQFAEYHVDLLGSLKTKNTIEVRFTSPVLYAKEKSSEYHRNRGHLVPPVCPPSTYHGECHPNFIRKAQYSFGWDWGPAIPTMGISKTIQVVAFDDIFMDDFSWTTQRTQDSWTIHGDVRVFTGGKYSDVNVVVVIDELLVSSGGRFFVTSTDTVVLLPFTLRIPRSKVQLWWPNGEGEQRLYRITAKASAGSYEQEITHHIGFRHVELIQDYVDEKDKAKGRHFYVKVNDRPIFLKGSNWIPISMFLPQNNSERMKFLLDSAVETGMNTLRVWGGGVYESDEFYDYSDSKGILLWQDLMFACALYPTDDGFLGSVETEVNQQIWRLKRHSSILLWAGNNENEVAIRSHWWSVENYGEDDQVKDYVRLYNGLVKPLVEAGDPSRPFLLSSPSNGQQTEDEGGVSANPGDQRYGDIHFYDELRDLWRDNSYLTPRCATEFGVQSLPFASTMLKHINFSEWFYTSEQLAHRQHKPGGILTNLLMVFSHFPIPFQCTQSLVDLSRCDFLKSPQFIDRYAYFSQANQAITYKIQTEHYRRHRNLLLPSGLGNTMCSLYWQLNDVWAAPTWSTVDFDLNWKIAHYEARRFMAPLIVVIYAFGLNDMGVTVVNDLPEEIRNATVQIDMFAWTNGFDSVFSQRKVIDIAPISATEVDLPQYKSMWQTGDADFLIRARLCNSVGGLLAPEAVLLPSKLYEIDFNVFGDVSIADFTVIDDFTYQLSITATSLSPYTWIAVSKPFTGWFSDNGFTMTVPTRKVMLHLRHPLKLFEGDFHVCNLKNCGVQ